MANPLNWHFDLGRTVSDSRAYPWAASFIVMEMLYLEQKATSGSIGPAHAMA
jgi:hypothetical protein